MGRALAISGIIAAILIAIGAFWILYVPSASAAVLYVDEGIVEVDIGKGWAPGQDEMELKQGAKVRTREGTASVVLLEGEVLHLEPNTEITLSEINQKKISIKQALGETWHKITRISGISTYEVETPTTVATVRGTEFFVKIGEEEDEVAVNSGEVEVGFAKKPGKRLMVGAKRMMKLHGKLERMTEKEQVDEARMEKFREKYVTKLKRTRLREIRKNKQIINMAKKRYDVTDEQIENYFAEVDEGKRDLDKDYEQLPGIMKKKLERAYKVTKVIQEAKPRRVDRRVP